MPHRVVHLEFLAPIPVGHRVELEYFEYEAGVVKPTMRIDKKHPVVVDLETGIRWHGPRHSGPSFARDPGQQHARSEIARVVACDVQTYGSDAIGLRTRLTLDPEEKIDPAGPYRASG